MPSAVTYIPPSSVERKGFMSEVENERRIRREGYKTALQYYKGEAPSQLEFDPQEDDHDDNTPINLVKMTADRTVSFLFSKLPVVQTDPASVDDTPEEVWIKDFFEANGGLQKLALLALRGFLAGHAFVRVKPVPEKRRGRVNEYPKMVVLDPTSVTVYWKADDVADVLWYEMRYMNGDTIYIQDFVKDEANDQWVIYTYRSTHSAGNGIDGFPNARTAHGNAGVVALDLLDFEQDGQFVLESRAIHKSPIAPIIEFPHLPNPDDYYGLGEVNQLPLQDAINRVASIRNQLVTQNAQPVDVIIGADPDEVEPQDGFMVVSSPTAKVQRLELKGDLAGISTTLDKLIETYLAIVRVVLLKGEAKDLQRVTNASVRTLFLDALAKNELLQSAYGNGLRKIVHLALSMAYEMGAVATNPDTLKLTVVFAEPLPTDETEIANQNATMLNAGAMSLRTAATRMGLDWKFETAAKETEMEVAQQNALRDGEVAAQNAAALAAAVPEPKAPPAKTSG